MQSTDIVNEASAHLPVLILGVPFARAAAGGCFGLLAFGSILDEAAVSLVIVAGAALARQRHPGFVMRLFQLWLVDVVGEPPDLPTKVLKASGRVQRNA